MTLSPRPQAQRFLTFFIESHLFAIPVRNIREISLVSEVEAEEHPHRIVVRDQSISVVDFRQKLGLEKKAFSADARIIIVQTPKGPVGVRVDMIDRVINRSLPPHESTEQPLLSLLSHNQSEAEFILLVDILGCLDASPDQFSSLFYRLLSPVLVRAS